MRYSFTSISLLAFVCTALAAPQVMSLSDNSYDPEIPPTADQPNEPIWLREHNEYRAKHGSPALQEDAGLTRFASDYVRKMNCKMVHSGKHPENLAWGKGGGGDANSRFEGSVKMWYDENKKYNYQNGVFSGETGHFTQVVWRSAKKVGCGYTTCGDEWLVSCNYDAGNMRGQFQDNVRPPR